MTRTILGIVLIVAEVLVAPPVGQTPPPAVAQSAVNAFLITPGVGIGHVKIGMPIGVVVSLLGAPKNVCRGLGKGDLNVYTWFETTDRCSVRPDSSGGLRVDTDLAGIVTSVLAYKDARYFLQNGLHVGSDSSLIRGRMEGDPLYSIGLDGAEHFQFSALGISFHTTGRSTTSISVSRPRAK